MADGKPIIIEEIEILDAGQSTGGTGSTFYSLPDQEEITIEREETTATVEDGQTIINVIDGTLNVLLYDDDILSDSHVQTGTSIPTNKSKIIAHGATGTDDISFDNIRPRVLQDDTGTRRGYRLQASKRSTSDPFS